LTIVAFLAETPGSATIEEQKAQVDPDDFVVVAENRSFSQLADLLAQAGSPLQAGDRIKIHALNCLGLSTDMLVRSFSKLLQAGSTSSWRAHHWLSRPGKQTAIC
jgi:hypothetical protein